MKALPWIIAAAAIGAAAYVLSTNPGLQYATGSDNVEDAARSTSNWGTKTRLRGAGGKFVGKAKQAVGNLTGDDQLTGEGIGDQIAGGVAKAAGQVAQAAGETLHDLNR
jgi:uncharacterized protein YjbJ (UPF0337 family)